MTTRGEVLVQRSRRSARWESSSAQETAQHPPASGEGEEGSAISVSPPKGRVKNTHRVWVKTRENVIEN